MSRGINTVILIGNLGKDPEIRYSGAGKAIANFSIAIGSAWKDKNTGEKKEHTEWVNVVAFGRLGEVVSEFLKKGSQVYVEGKLTTEKWQDKEGKDCYTTKVIIHEMQMLGGKPDSGQGSGQSASADQYAAKSGGSSTGRV